MTSRLKWILGLLILFLVFNAAAFTFLLTAQRSPVAISWKGGRTGTPLIGGPFTLTSADGRTVTDQTYRGKWMLIYFGYTFCPDACPTALSNMSIALQKLGSEADKLQPLFITVDPKRDTRQVMSAYLESFDPRIVGLVGTQAQTDAVAKTYRVYFEPHKDGGDNYLIDHSAYFYLMDPDGKFVDVIEGVTPGDQMAERLRELISEHST
jgi:protein SCO1/2